MTLPPRDGKKTWNLLDFATAAYCRIAGFVKTEHRISGNKTVLAAAIVMQLTEFGAWRCLPEKKMGGAMQQLPGFSHLPRLGR
jgi:hypothetical protein